ncbi:MAG: carbamoyltransferase HypF [Nitrospirae bacterium]|nr:carbamoyltransferase HypF [Nitrospirota bacterium]
MLSRLIIHLNGAVQGVGFRPFVYNLAADLKLNGYVLNNTEGVLIEIEGAKGSLDEFLLRLNKEKPSLSHISTQDIAYAEPLGYTDFQIKESRYGGQIEAVILSDIATCQKCIDEVIAPDDRRGSYPFTNCTNCGPRFTIIERLPYDRRNTTMKDFMMCLDCQQEYDNPSNRRFHAQPNACPVCGPHVILYRPDGALIAERGEAIEGLISGIRQGLTAAVKGLGGFHLMCDARNDDSVRLLRQRKMRQEKPFAVMVSDIETAKKYAELSALEEALLLSPEKGIVLVNKKESDLADSVAPGLKRIGIFLPYTPLHHIILKRLDFPVVATSGNISDEPIIKNNDEALNRLSMLTDMILVHNRPIKRRCDDSVVKVIAGFPVPLRRARGYAPLTINLPFKLRQCVLAVGGFYKNTFAIGRGEKIIMSHHIGDIETVEGVENFEEAVSDLCRLYDFEPDVIAYDLHPGYETTRWAMKQDGVRKIGVQHHFAHILSCMVENNLGGDVLGIAWDGTGYGLDGSLWGGEFLKCSYNGFERLAYFRPLRLIGGEKAVKEPARIALSILFELYGDDFYEIKIPTLQRFSMNELNTLFAIWRKGINSPYSSSAGRLFDALASMLGIRQTISYEGQAAIMIEDLYREDASEPYPFEIKDGVIDWRGMFHSIIKDIIDGHGGRVPSRFINTLANIALAIARQTNIQHICLSGGVFQNSPLTERIIRPLRDDLNVYTHKRLPPNDGGISVGQAVYAGLLSI